MSENAFERRLCLVRIALRKRPPFIIRETSRNFPIANERIEAFAFESQPAETADRLGHGSHASDGRHMSKTKRFQGGNTQSSCRLGKMSKRLRRGVAVFRRILRRPDSEAADDQQDDPCNHGRTIADGEEAMQNLKFQVSDFTSEI